MFNPALAVLVPSCPILKDISFNFISAALMVWSTDPDMLASGNRFCQVSLLATFFKAISSAATFIVGFSSNAISRALSKVKGSISFAPWVFCAFAKPNVQSTATARSIFFPVNSLILFINWFLI